MRSVVSPMYPQALVQVVTVYQAEPAEVGVIGREGVSHDLFILCLPTFLLDCWIDFFSLAICVTSLKTKLLSLVFYLMTDSLMVFSYIFMEYFLLFIFILIAFYLPIL